MKYLLDTHTVLWFFDEVEKLPEKTLETVMDLENQKFVSIVTAWELAIKISLGKLDFDGGVENFFNKIDENGFELLQLKKEHLRLVEVLPLLHRDPFDRLLIASVISEEMIFITADVNIQKYEISWIW